MSNQNINNNKFVVENDGTLSVSTALYESLVTSDNDIPNRKFVVDLATFNSLLNIYVDKNGNDTTGDGSSNAPYLTITKALSVIPAATNSAEMRRVWVINVSSGTYDEDLSCDIGRKKIILLCNGSVNLGEFNNSNWAPSGTQRNITITCSLTSIDSIRPSFSIVSDNSGNKGTHQAYSHNFRLSGTLSISNSTGGTSGEIFLDGCGLFGWDGAAVGNNDSITAGSWAGNLNVYMTNTRCYGVISGGVVRLQRANDCQFDKLATLATYSGIYNCVFAAGMTWTVAPSEVPPVGLINCNITGTFTGAGGSNLLIDSTTNNYFATNGCTVAGGAAKVLLDEARGIEFDPSGLNVIPSTTVEAQTALSNLDDSQYVEINTGFLSWGAGTTYFTVTGTDFTVDRSGIGYIKGKKISWVGGQTVTGLTANETTFIYIDSTGTIGGTTIYNEALYQNNIVLFEALNDGTNIIVVKENHPINFQTGPSRYLHNNVGTVIRSTGAIISRVTTGTGGAAGDREIKIVGSDILEDHGLETTIADSSGAGVTWNIYYTNASGDWIRYAQQTQLPMYYNNAGTPTALTTGPNSDTGVYRLYVSKDNINSSSPTYYAIMNSSVYNTIALAQAAISAGTISGATNELNAIELAQLGYAIVENNATSGYINTLVVQKSSFNTKIISGSSSSHLTLGDINGGQYGLGGHTNAAQVKISASSAPTVNDDIDLYKELSFILKQDTDNVFVNTDNTDSAAIWKTLVTTVGVTPLTSSRIPYATTNGDVTDSVNLTFDGTKITANAAEVTNDLTVQGNVYVNGEKIQVDKKISTSDALIAINFEEPGAGLTAPVAGIEIDRGSLDPYAIIFKESNDTIRGGEYYTTLNYSSLTGSFTLNQEITGGTSGATAYVVSDTGSSAKVKVVIGSFTPTETITSLTGSATLDSVVVTDNTQAIATRLDSMTDKGVAYWDNANYQLKTESGFTYDEATNTLTVETIVASSLQKTQVKTSDYPVLTTESSGLFTNEGAGGQVIFTLPTASAGLRYDFYVQAAQYLQVKANTGDTIRHAGSVSASAGYIRANVVGNYISVVAVNATEWIVDKIVGTWTIDA